MSIARLMCGGGVHAVCRLAAQSAAAFGSTAAAHDIDDANSPWSNCQAKPITIALYALQHSPTQHFSLPLSPCIVHRSPFIVHFCDLSLSALSAFSMM